MRQLRQIIIHCTDTRPNWWKSRTAKQKAAEVRRWHIEERHFTDIGYHFLIDRDGTVVEGRPLAEQGAHVAGQNADSIGIALFGGHGASASDDFLDHFTEDQDAALRKLLAKLCAENVLISKIAGHNEYAAKACPGFDVWKWLKKEGPNFVNPLVRTPQRSTPAKSTTVQASAVQIASGLGAGVAALGSLDGTAQLLALGFAFIIVLAAAWIMRERLRKWSEGIR